MRDSLSTCSQKAMSAPSTSKRRQRSTRMGWQSFTGFAVRFCGIGLSYLTLLFLTRHLGPEQYGAFSAVLSLSALLATVMTAGADRIATRSISSLGSDSRIELIREVVVTHAVALVGVGLGLATLTAVYVFGGHYIDVGSAGLIASLAMVVFPVMVLISVRQWIALPLHGAAASIVPEQIVLPALLLASAAVIKTLGFTFDFSLVAILYAASGFVAWCVGVRYSDVRGLLNEGLKSRVTAGDVMARVRSGMPFLSATLSTVMMNRAVPLIVAAVCGFAATGKLAVAVQLAAIAAVPLTVVNLAIVPRCVKQHTRRDHASLARTVRLACTLCVAMTVPLGLGLLFFSETAVGMMGKDFQGASTLMSILVIGQCINACCGPNGSILQMIGHEKLYSSAMLMTNSAQVVAVLLASVTGNLVAVALSIVVIEGLRNIVLSVLLWQKERLLMLPTFSVFRTQAAAVVDDDERSDSPPALGRAA
ncbi:oligosaccharide flippase family protein [bacterium]|nr:oligosaccharide flippase family protein [bacterium]